MLEILRNVEIIENFKLHTYIEEFGKHQKWKKKIKSSKIEKVEQVKRIRTLAKNVQNKKCKEEYRIEI